MCAVLTLGLGGSELPYPALCAAAFPHGLGGFAGGVRGLTLVHHLDRGLRRRAPTDAEQGPLLHSVCPCLLVLSRPRNRPQAKWLAVASFSLAPSQHSLG